MGMDSVGGVGGGSLSDGLAQLASNIQGGNLKSQIAGAVMKQIKDSQQIQGEMIIKLIQSSPSPDPAVGRNFDRSA
jgi:hypothetical protein